MFAYAVVRLRGKNYIRPKVPDRQTNRRTDRHTDRQTDRQTHTHTHTHRQTDRQSDGHTDMVKLCGPSQQVEVRENANF